MILRAFLALLLAAALPALAQQYRWTDEKGQTRVTDTPPPPGARNVRRIESAAPQKPAAGESNQQMPFELQRLQKDFPVSLFTAPICKEPCGLARALLNKRGIPFTEIQVWNVETLEELKQAAGNDSVPALRVGRSVTSGFDQGRFDALLDSAGYPQPGAFPPRAQAEPTAPEGYVPPPTAEPVAGSDQAVKPGPYDASGLKGPPPKPGIYDPSGLKGPPPKPGRYGVPSQSTK